MLTSLTSCNKEGLCRVCLKDMWIGKLKNSCKIHRRKTRFNMEKCVKKLTCSKPKLFGSWPQQNSVFSVDFLQALGNFQCAVW